MKSAREVAVHGLPLHGQHADPTVNGMIVSGLLKCGKRHVGMHEQISMCITSVDGKCYDSARACGESKLSDTEEVNSRSLRFSQSRYVGRCLCANGAVISWLILVIASVCSQAEQSAGGQVQDEFTQCFKVK